MKISATFTSIDHSYHHYISPISISIAISTSSQRCFIHFLSSSSSYSQFSLSEPSSNFATVQTTSTLVVRRPHISAIHFGETIGLLTVDFRDSNLLAVKTTSPLFKSSTRRFVSFESIRTIVRSLLLLMISGRRNLMCVL